MNTVPCIRTLQISPLLQITLDTVCPPTTLTFQGAALSWQGIEQTVRPALLNRGSLSAWVGVTIRITRLEEQSWRNAAELAAALDSRLRIVHVNPEGVTAMLDSPLEPGGQCLLFASCSAPEVGQPIPVELQGTALPSGGIEPLMAMRLLLPAGGIR